MVILGIDPGTARMGFAIIKKPKSKNLKPKVIDFGCVTTDKFLKDGARLKKIYNETKKLIQKHRPDLLSVENLYFFKNIKTALPVSQAKGVVLLAASKKDIPVIEFTPLQVKMAIAGYGRAEKKQVQRMLREFLDLDNFDFKKNNRKRDDAADALGIALCAILK